MDYHLSWDGTSTILGMDIVYDSHSNDSTVFIYGVPEAGGQPHIFDILGNVQAGNGERLNIIAAERKIIVHHVAPGIKTLHAELDARLVPGPRFRANEAFRPTLAPGFLYTRGYQLFMEVSDTAYNQLGIVWSKWPAHMPYLVSTNPEARPDELQVIAAEATTRYLFMMVMDKDMVITKSKVGGIPHYLATSKSDSTSGMLERVRFFADKYIPAIRDYWQDYNAPFYILSVIPFQNEVPAAMTGMGMSNGLSVRYRGPLDLDKTQLIAHETSHNWIGVRLKFESIGMENNWFNEGFNDYIAICNLVRAGLFSQQDFLDYMNKENLAAHYTSPVRSMPGDSIAPNFFKSKYYEKLPYHRGLIYAFYLDNQIRLAANGKASIRNFLQALYTQNQKDGGRVITTVDFTKAISPFLPGVDIAKEIDEYMLQGRLIDFHHVHLIPAFKIKYADTVPVLKVPAGVDIRDVLK
jgi:predicted metalloprotease with PDZ domain